MQTYTSRRVNAPRFDGSVRISETAIFWFGRVTPTLNSVDARIGYNSEHLLVRVAAFDRRLWYDPSHSPEDLTAWDAVTLYLDTYGTVGEAPDPNAYRFDAQLVWWEEPRDDWQIAYKGDGSSWVMADIPFTTSSGWRGHAPNNAQDDRGWVLAFRIPFDSLGLDGPPWHGAVWGLALALHDRDDLEGTPIADQVWPEAMDPQQPVTWGELAFGLPAYTPPPSLPGGTVVVRHGLNGANVVDADVGGSSVCGSAAAPEFFPTWGSLNYAGKDFLNIQNQGDVADWPCFSKYYVSFPLDEIPPDKIVVSATLTLRQWGHAGEGWDPGPQPSLIQVLSVGEDWDEAEMTWNSAPLAAENITATWSEPLENPGWPGEDRSWDVSRAVAAAYAEGIPVRLALYEADYAYHSGKYFYSSDNWYEEGRPTLSVTWGQPVASVEKGAAPSSGKQNDPATYTLNVYGTGRSLTLTDTLPVGVGAPGAFALEGTSVTPKYDSIHHRLTWSDTVSVGTPVTLRYTVTITTSMPQALVNKAELRELGGDSSVATATIVANPYQCYLPVLFKVSHE
jgi:hypothetical protein